MAVTFPLEVLIDLLAVPLGVEEQQHAQASGTPIKDASASRDRRGESIGTPLNRDERPCSTAHHRPAGPDSVGDGPGRRM
jgi:hypothetical protein